MSSKDAILKRNLEFIYGRHKPDEDVLPSLDPDKFKIIPGSRPKEKAFDPESTIFEFSGDHAGLAPGFPADVFVPLTDYCFPSFEHALQATKFVDMASHAAAIKALSEVKDVKRFVSKLKQQGSAELYEDWNERCVEVGRGILRDKFMRHKALKIMLMRTGHKKLVYRNSFNDQFWGVNPAGEGQNHLGRLLEAIRDEIDKEVDVARWLASYFTLLDSDLARVKVSVLENGAKTQEDQVVDEKAVVYIGKADACDVVVRHPSVSRAHAVLVLTAQQAYVVDLDSSNGTFIGDDRLRPFSFVSVRSGVSVRFGAATACYQFEIFLDASDLRQQELMERIARADEAGGEEQDANTVFVGGLLPQVTEDDVRAFFAPCGTVVHASVPRDRNSQSNRGIAFVTFSAFSGVIQAVSRDGDELRGQTVRVKRSEVKSSGSKPPGSRPQGSGPRSQSDRKPQRKESDEKSYYGPQSGQRGGRDSDRGRDRAAGSDRSRSRSREKRPRRDC